MEKFTVVILAAGRGVRMKSDKPKVLCELSGKPLIHYVLNEVYATVGVGQVIAVLGHKAPQVKKYINDNFRGVDFVYQRRTLGTAHAVGRARKSVRCNNLLVLCGDAPLITSRTLSAFVRYHKKNKFSLSLVSACYDRKNQMGVVIRDRNNSLCGICEKIDLVESSPVREVNSGIYAFKKKDLFANLDKIPRNKKKGEYFLTDIVNILYNQNKGMGVYCLDDNRQILGINNPVDLALAEDIMRKRLIHKHLELGVKIVDINSTFIAPGASIGKNTVIYPFTFIENDVIIGSNCLLGPFLRLRKGTIIKDGTRLGNFIEVNRSTLGPAVTMKHFGYLGDSVVEKNVNIGAGAVAANYDGKKKHKTAVGENSFIGCDTVLVAPVKIGRGALTAAGSVVTRDVPAKGRVAGVPARPIKKREKRR